MGFGITMTEFYGGGPPGASPTPSSLNMSVDPMNDSRIRPAWFWVGIIVALAAIRLLYEWGEEI